MEKIEIFISSLGREIRLIIDVSKNIVIDNNIVKEISPTKIVSLYSIIKDWKDSYGCSSLSEERFIIRFYNNLGVREIRGNGSYPSNYFEFKKWLDTLYEG